jgi:hypothetical protein
MAIAALLAAKRALGSLWWREDHETAEEWAFATRLLFSGDTSARLLGILSGRVRRGLCVTIPVDVQTEVLASVRRHGFPVMYGSSRCLCAEEQRLLIRMTENLMRYPDYGVMQLAYAAAFGDVKAVDWLLREGVEPVQPFMDNSVLEYAAAMGHVGVVRRLLQHPGADPAMFSTENMGTPPMVAALDVIKARKRIQGPHADVCNHWQVVQALLEAAKGSPILRQHDMVVEAPLFLLHAMAFAEPAFMCRHAADMAGHLCTANGRACCPESEWTERFAVVQCFLDAAHPLAAFAARSCMTVVKPK